MDADILLVQQGISLTVCHSSILQDDPVRRRAHIALYLYYNMQVELTLPDEEVWWSNLQVEYR